MQVNGVIQLPPAVAMPAFQPMMNPGLLQLIIAGGMGVPPAMAMQAFQPVMNQAVMPVNQGGQIPPPVGMQGLQPNQRRRIVQRRGRARNQPPPQELIEEVQQPRQFREGIARQFIDGLAEGFMGGPGQTVAPFRSTFRAVISETAREIASCPAKCSAQDPPEGNPGQGGSTTHWPHMIIDNEFVYFLSSVHIAKKVVESKGYYACWNCKTRAHFRINGEMCRPDGVNKVPVPQHRSTGCDIESWLRHGKRADFIKACRQYVEEHCEQDPLEIHNYLIEHIEMAQKVSGMEGISISRKTVLCWRARGLERPGTAEQIRWHELEKYGIGTAEKVTWLLKYSLKPKFVFLMTDKGKNCLLDAPIWMVDGTFRSCPGGYSQLLTFMAVVMKNGEEYYIPCAHMLVDEQSSDCYYSALSELLSRMRPKKADINAAPPGLRLDRIIIDFDEAERSGFQAVIDRFGLHTVISGCLFHYGQALWRFFHKTYGNKATPLEKMVFQVYLWLPYFKTQREVHRLVHRLGQKVTCSKLWDYFNKWWMPRLSWWWVGHDSRGITTNSAIESFHRRLNKAISFAHPPFMELHRILFVEDNYCLSLLDINQQKGERKERKLEVFESNRTHIQGVIDRLIENLKDKEQRAAETTTANNDRGHGKLSASGVAEIGQRSQEPPQTVGGEAVGGEAVLDLLFADIYEGKGNNREFSSEKIENYLRGRNLLP
jgi:hypothetical protein